MTGARRPVFKTAAAIMIMLVMVACAGYQPSAEPGAPSPTRSPAAKRGTTHPPKGKTPAASRNPSYNTINLPEGDGAAADADYRIYELLRHKDCLAAQQELDHYFANLDNPSHVLILQAVIEACADHRKRAKELFDLLHEAPSTTDNRQGEPLTVRNAYQALVGYLDKVPMASVSADDYPITSWPDGAPDGGRDYDYDPRSGDFPPPQPATGG